MVEQSFRFLYYKIASRYTKILHLCWFLLVILWSRCDSQLHLKFYVDSVEWLGKTMGKSNYSNIKLQLLTLWQFIKVSEPWLFYLQIQMCHCSSSLKVLLQTERKAYSNSGIKYFSHSLPFYLNIYFFRKEIRTC